MSVLVVVKNIIVQSSSLHGLALVEAQPYNLELLYVQA